MPTRKLTIRRARPEQADRLTELAHASKRRWGYEEPLIALWRQALTLTPDFIAGHQVYVAESDGEIVGVYGLVQKGTEASLEHMWVHPDAMGTGVGKQLFDHAVRVARTGGAHRLEIVSDPNAEGFYLRMGAARVGTSPSVPAGRMLPKLVLTLASGAESDQVP
jgi:GNAT superfamily N-acetyltransferase